VACSAVLFIAFTPFGPSRSFAAQFTAEAVKAAYLYRFASYVEWPADAPAAGAFVIAVAGDEKVAIQLERLLRGLTVHGRPTTVRRVTKAQEIEDVHILYVGPTAFARTRALRERAILLPILIVTDDVDGLDGGGVINFTASERNVRFEISLVAADRGRLKIHSALLSIATRVERRPQVWENR
jgi:hypothetical protein